MKMHTSHAALTLLFLASSSNAFFALPDAVDGVREAAGSFASPFHHGSATKRALTQRDGKPEQKNPGIFISIAPFRSAARYKVRSAPLLPPTHTQELNRRDNEYKIVTADKPSQPTSLPIDQDGTDYSYFSQMGIGSKETSMYMLLDTGSAVTWVMADNCKSGPCAIHNTFGSSSGSSTLKTGGASFKLDYGSGEVAGTNANDSISFAGLKVTVPIGLADTVSDDFHNYPFDGILGLGRVPISNQPPVTFLQEIAQNKLLPANVFGVNLQRNSDSSHDGEINFGAADTSKFKGDLHWVDTVQDHSFWEIPTDDIYVNGKSVGLNQHRTAILDTGTSYMLIPPSDAKAVFDQIPGASSPDGTYYTVPCDSNVPIQVVLGGVGFNISAKDYVGPANGKRDNGCPSHIVGLAAAGDDKTWLLGDTFLKNVYSVFDADKNRIGFGAKTGSSVINEDAANNSAKDSSTGTSTESSSGGSSPSSSSSGSHPSVTGGLGLPGTSSSGGSGSGSGSGASPAGSSGAAAPSGSGSADSKASAGTSFSVDKLLVAMVAAALSLSFL